MGKGVGVNNVKMIGLIRKSKLKKDLEDRDEHYGEIRKYGNGTDDFWKGAQWAIKQLLLEFKD